MKILLCGATGYIGTEVLKQLIQHNYVTHIYCLTRRPLEPEFATHRKVTQILHENFGDYPAHLVTKLAGYGIEGCIWCVGRVYKKHANKSEAEQVEAQFPIRAAEALAAGVAPALDPDAPRQKFPFRFALVSAWGAEQDQLRSLWAWADSRKIKGAAERGVFDVAEASAEIKGKRCFEAIALRPGTVIAGGDAITTIVSEAVVPCIAVDRLAKKLIRVVMQGAGDKKTLENAECLGDDWALVNSLQF